MKTRNNIAHLLSHNPKISKGSRDRSKKHGIDPEVILASLNFIATRSVKRRSGEWD